MATSWITGICARKNRLEWTVLRRVKEAWEVHAHGEWDLPAGEGGTEWSSAALKPLAKNFRGLLSVALPTESVLLRVGLLPSADPEELRGMAELQTDKYSPFPVENMALGAETLEATDHSSLMAMAAVRRDAVESLGKRFQDAGVPPDVVDVEALGWWWALKSAGQVPLHGSQIFVRATACGVEMAVARDGAPLLFRSLPAMPEDPASPRSEWVAECAEETGYSLTSLETE